MHALATYILAETAKWRTLDGSQEGPEAFARDWNETAAREGTREEVAQRWGIDPQIASNRAQALKKAGYRIEKFKRGNPDARHERSINKARIDPWAVAKFLQDHGGDLKATAEQFDLSMQEIMAVIRSIKSSFPNINIVTRGRGRPKLPLPIDVDDFQEIWNSSTDRDDMYDKFLSNNPDFHKDRVNAIAKVIRRDHPETFLKDLPVRKARWRLQNEPGEGDYSSVFEPSGDEAQVSTQNLSDEELWNRLSADEQAPTEPVAGTEPPALARAGLSPADSEFLEIWNGAVDLGDAVRGLKKSGWSLLAVKAKRAELQDRGVELRVFDDE